jgi:hypothetical protein
LRILVLAIVFIKFTPARIVLLNSFDRAAAPGNVPSHKWLRRGRRFAK